MGGPTAGQIESYRRDGFLIVERFLETDDLDRVREHFMSVFEHEWETGLAPDEVNYVPGVTAPDLTRQLCNVWKADRVLAGVTLSRQVGEFADAAGGAARGRGWRRTTRSGSRRRERRCCAIRTPRISTTSIRRT